MDRFLNTAGNRFWVAVLLCSAVLFSSCGHHMPAKRKTLPELLEDMTNSTDDHIRAAAVRELGTRQEPAAVNALIVALQDVSVPVRSAAVAALVSSKDPRVSDALWIAAKDPSQDRGFQVAAASALAHQHDARAADLLIQALPYARSRASASLLELGPAALPPLIDALHRPDTREAVSRILAPMGAVAVDSLIQVLHNDYDKYARLAAAATLAEIDDLRAVAALTELLRAPNVEFVAAVYRFLIRRGEPGTEVQLINALNTYGNPAMAEDFDSSGSAALKAAAEHWSRDNGISLAERTSDLPQVHWAAVDRKR